MEYVYSALLLHACRQGVNEANVKKVLEAAGVRPDEGRVKSLVAALESVNIEEAIKEAAVAPVAVAQAAQIGGAQAPAAKQEKKEEKKSEEAAAAGLAGLFG